MIEPKQGHRVLDIPILRMTIGLKLFRTVWQNIRTFLARAITYCDDIGGVWRVAVEVRDSERKKYQGVGIDALWEEQLEDRFK